MHAVSDQESEPAATAEEEVVPVKLEEKLLERFVSQATQTAAGVTEVAGEVKEGGEGEDVKVEEEPPQVQITASLGEVRYRCKITVIMPMCTYITWLHYQCNVIVLACRRVPTTYVYVHPACSVDSSILQLLHRIDAFVQYKRHLVDVSNQIEFCHRSSAGKTSLQ